MSERPLVLQAFDALNARLAYAQTLADAFGSVYGDNPPSIALVWEEQMRDICRTAESLEIELRRHLGGEFA